MENMPDIEQDELNEMKGTNCQFKQIFINDWSILQSSIGTQ